MEDNIKMDLKEIGYGDVNWVNLTLDGVLWRGLLNTAMRVWRP
jgi:hypothetical protein